MIDMKHQSGRTQDREDAEAPVRAVQRFAGEYLDRCRELTPDQIARFLEDFRVVHGGRKPDAASDSKARVGSGAVRTRLFSATGGRELEAQTAAPEAEARAEAEHR